MQVQCSYTVTGLVTNVCTDTVEVDSSAATDDEIKSKLNQLIQTERPDLYGAGVRVNNIFLMIAK